jgi:hypothetical protein
MVKGSSKDQMQECFPATIQKEKTSDFTWPSLTLPAEENNGTVSK